MYETPLLLVSACSPWPSLLSVRCSEEKETNFYSSDSDFDDEEPKKFHIQIRPVASSNRSHSVATEKELKATVGALTLPPNRGARQQVSGGLRVSGDLKLLLKRLQRACSPGLFLPYSNYTDESKPDL